jgi:hypothetical protein
MPARISPEGSNGPPCLDDSPTVIRRSKRLNPYLPSILVLPGLNALTVTLDRVGGQFGILVQHDAGRTTPEWRSHSSAVLADCPLDGHLAPVEAHRSNECYGDGACDAQQRKNQRSVQPAEVHAVSLAAVGERDRVRSVRPRGGVVSDRLPRAGSLRSLRPWQRSWALRAEAEGRSCVRGVKHALGARPRAPH